jgi:LuxR family transcriptional regulator, maltose regulon positive regulatory protein
MTVILPSSLVLTKLRIPALRKQVIHRLNLLEQFSSESGKGFILVSAPAGYGKTTLLAEWARSARNDGAVVAWYAIDPSDDVPGTFGAYLTAALTQAFGPLPGLERITGKLRTSVEVELQGILPELINTIVASQRECILILDDYQQISSPAIHSAVAYLLEHLPENMRLALGSRSDPPLPLARLRARGQMLEVRASSLRFTPEETACFLNEVMLLDLPAEMVETLEARSEGWAAGLQLAALSLAGREDKESFVASFSGSHRYLVEYLLDEVVERQSTEMRKFLLVTSILERICAPLCDALLGPGSQSGDILEQIERLNLFVVPLDDQGYWFRYHHLFRDFLKARLDKKGPAYINTLRRQASEWLAGQGFLREAARHAFQTQDWEYAAAFVEQHAFTMIIHSEISTIYEWCTAFPEEVMRRHALLCIHQCWAWVFSFQRENRPRVEERLQLAEQALLELEDEQRAGEIREMMTVVRAFLIMAPDRSADPEHQLALATRMLAGYPSDDPGRFSALLATGYAQLALQEAATARQTFETARQIALQEHLYFGYVESTFHLAQLALIQGDLRLAADLCRHGRKVIESLLEHPDQELPALGCLDIALGCSLLEQDQLEEAEDCLLRGLELIGWGVNHYYLLTGLLGLARLREVQGRPAEAVETLQRLEAAWPDISFLTQGLAILTALRAQPGDPQAQANGEAWLREHANLWDIDAPPGMGPFAAAQAYYLAELVSMRFQIGSRQEQAALARLESRLAAAEANGLSVRVIELSLLEALALRASDEEARFHQALERALRQGEMNGYVHTFNQGAEMTLLLIQAARRGIHSRYIERLLNKLPPVESLKLEMRPQPGQIIETPGLEWVETLSQRELEVLRLIAQGASNQEIAERLILTVGTVKSHINHMLRKLQARNRTEAVARARQLGWLDV